MKGILAYVYRRTGEQGNNTFVAINPNIVGPFEPKRDCPAVHIVEENLGRFGTMWRAYPDDGTGKPLKGGMWGGNFLYTTDSRFNELTDGNPVKIFDRVE